MRKSPHENIVSLFQSLSKNRQFKKARLDNKFTLVSVDCCLLAFEAFGDALDKIDHNNPRFFYCIIFAWGIGQN